MKAIIITPAYSHTRHELTPLVLETGLPWCRVHEHSDLPRVRSALLGQALDSDAEAIVLLDADTIPESASAICALANQATPSEAVFGLYPVRDGDAWAVEPEEPELAASCIDRGRPFPLRTSGLGFCAIHRSSLLRVAETLPTIVEARGSWRPFCLPYVENDDTGAPRYYGDDRSLCRRLIATGTKLRCDPTLRAGHAVTTIKWSLDGQRKTTP